jgi:2,3-diaminopropionate biosynthesis protein SbnB
LLVVTGHVVAGLLQHREDEILAAVEQAYLAHSIGACSLPQSTFLRFPNDSANRIIALPAYLGDRFEVAGIKWIASFPSNVHRGMDRASAAILLNSLETGQVQTVLEGSVISAKRTAASAALAARAVHQPATTSVAGLIGCGYINFEIAGFLRVVFPSLSRVVVYDIVGDKANYFSSRCAGIGLSVEIANSPAAVFERAQLISIATTAAVPHLSGEGFRVPGATVLHISLRDLAPQLIMTADNIVDDLDHVCRAQTSIHLTERLTGGRDFVRCNLADVLAGRQPARAHADSFLVFSPFGLGVLDVAVAALVRDLALADGHGIRIESFLPPPWHSVEQYASTAASRGNP